MLQQYPDSSRADSRSERPTDVTPGAAIGRPRIALPRALVWTSAAVLAAFAVPLYRLAAFAAADSRHSHILLVPVISVYLVWSDRRPVQSLHLQTRSVTNTIAAFAVLLLAGFTMAWPPPAGVAQENWLFVATTAFAGAVTASAAWLYGIQGVRVLRFPLAFVLFMVPIPTVAMALLERLSQYGSAFVAHALFRGAGTAVHVDGLIFQLPGITLHVAPECSGIRSTLVLFILSVLSGHFFLRTKMGALALSLAVLPLALLRNGFRIFTIGELCTHIGPHMIDSPIHRQGGPVFFALSIVPFFLLVLLLARWEARRRFADPGAA